MTTKQLTTNTIHVDPSHDSDIILSFASGQQIIIQSRPSNADGPYNGSLDIILPHPTHATSWRDDDLNPSIAIGNRQNCRTTKQIMVELPR